MQIEIYAYELPLTLPRLINGTALERRQGFYINIDGAWGEIAPLPGSSLQEVQQDLQEACQRLRQGLAHDAAIAAVQFGLDCALANISTAAWAADDSAPSLPLLEGPRDPIVRAWRCRRVHPTRAWLTLTGNVQYDAGLVRELCLLAPNVRLVLDAGGRLDSEQLSALWQRIDGSRIDWLLDPALDIPTGQQLAEQYQLPVAFDLARYHAESGVMARLPRFEQLKAVVLRPAELGGLATCRQLIEQARLKGLEVMVADSLQSGLGQRQLARLSQQWNPDTLAALGRCNYLLDSGINDQGQPHLTGLTPI